ncbi:hypothetical protein AWC22_14260 [Mycobacterium riyadhense]|uniref:Uncharacterized protein n=1 Tax=Mycobacterium riyadhense TaxID=486698 RepID=A0A1X2D7K5_9MYCO|nr:hypothetical protein AWC22_14260 [Mycobacterium riyadhense]
MRLQPGGLRALLPTGGRFSLAWMEAGEGEIVERSTTHDTILLVFRGAARLLGGRFIKAGDAVSIPANSVYRLAVAARDGLDALAITLGRTAAKNDDSEGVSSLAELIERNEERMRIASQGAIFQLVDDGTLNDPAKRAAFLRQIRPLSDTFQKTMIARQATCSDQAYEPTFLDHFKEEFGHNTLLPCDGPAAAPDPVVSATLVWFTHQRVSRSGYRAPGEHWSPWGRSHPSGIETETWAGLLGVSSPWFQCRGRQAEVPYCQAFALAAFMFRLSCYPLPL